MFLVELIKFGVVRGPQPYDIPCFYPGMPGTNAILLDLQFARTVNFPADFAGSSFKARTAATASYAIDIQKNGSKVGTITFAAGASTATLTGTGSTSVTFGPGDFLSLVAPASADATLTNLRGVLAGTR